MARRRRHRNVLETEHVDDQELLRDAEESLVAALQESDTAAEALADSNADASPLPGSRRRWTIGAAGLMLAVLGLVVARRRR
jgi:hypothetical protein